MIFNQNERPAHNAFMFYVYILQSLKDLRTYVGYSSDIERRIKEHNSGRVKSTKHRKPFKLQSVLNKINA